MGEDPVLDSGLLPDAGGGRTLDEYHTSRRSRRAETPQPSVTKPYRACRPPSCQSTKLTSTNDIRVLSPTFGFRLLVVSMFSLGQVSPSPNSLSSIPTRSNSHPTVTEESRGYRLPQTAPRSSTFRHGSFLPPTPGHRHYGPMASP